MDDEIADSVPLLTLATPYIGHFQIRIGIHINVAHTFVVLDDRNLGTLSHGADQAFAALSGGSEGGLDQAAHGAAGSASRR